MATPPRRERLGRGGTDSQPATPLHASLTRPEALPSHVLPDDLGGAVEGAVEGEWADPEDAHGGGGAGGGTTTRRSRRRWVWRASPQRPRPPHDAYTHDYERRDGYDWDAGRRATGEAAEVEAATDPYARQLVAEGPQYYRQRAAREAAENATAHYSAAECYTRAPYMSDGQVARLRAAEAQASAALARANLASAGGGGDATSTRFRCMATASGAAPLARQASPARKVARSAFSGREGPLSAREERELLAEEIQQVVRQMVQHVKVAKADLDGKDAEQPAAAEGDVEVTELEADVLRAGNSGSAPAPKRAGAPENEQPLLVGVFTSAGAKPAAARLRAPPTGAAKRPPRPMVRGPQEVSESEVRLSAKPLSRQRCAFGGLLALCMLQMLIIILVAVLIGSAVARSRG